MGDVTVIVDCPCCGVRMEVDCRTGKVLKHWQKPAAKPGADPMQEAMEKMKADKARLNDYFSNAGKSMDDKKKDLLDKFEKEKKKIEDSGDKSRPLNPFDLD